MDNLNFIIVSFFKTDLNSRVLISVYDSEVNAIKNDVAKIDDLETNIRNLEVNLKSRPVTHSL